MQSGMAGASIARGKQRWEQLAPGIGLAMLIGLLGYVLQQIEVWLVGQAVIEALVLAIMLGMAWRNLWGVSESLQPGISFTGKTLLECAIVLLGASVDLPALLRAGPTLLFAIVAVVCVGLLASVLIGRVIGLNPRLALLVAVGNSICGNSAIAAVAPVIQADKEDVASAIALTAILGVGLVLGLPLLLPMLSFSLYQYGVLAGMTVYAVPQVLAATLPVSVVSGDVGTLVKLVRVLLLGPVVLGLSLYYGATSIRSRFEITRFIPWFIIGFLLFAVLRSTNLLPLGIAQPLREISRWLTIAAMAALGLGVNIRVVRQVGASVALAVVMSLLVLILVSIGLIHGLGIGAR